MKPTALSAWIATVLLLVSVLTSCATAPRRVSVLAIWTGEEQRNFEAILAGFEAETGIEVDYQGTRAVDQVLESDVEKGSPPDIAILSRPNDLARYLRAGDLQPLNEVTGAARAAADRQPWQRKDFQQRLYTIAVKADLKSSFWYRSEGKPVDPPQTWDALLALARSTPGRAPFCLGVGSPPTTGWPATDWIEDILLHQSGVETYQLWTQGRLPWTSDQVRRAWQAWGSTVFDQIQGGNAAALLTDFGDAAKQNCALVHQTSSPGPGFVRLPVPNFAPDQPSVFDVAGDSAARFTNNPAAVALIRYLAEHQQINPPQLFSLHRLCFSAADLMPTAMTNAFYRAALEYLAAPSKLDTLLANLEAVRTSVPAEEWLTGSPACSAG